MIAPSRWKISVRRWSSPRKGRALGQHRILQPSQRATDIDFFGPQMMCVLNQTFVSGVTDVEPSGRRKLIRRSELVCDS